MDALLAGNPPAEAVVGSAGPATVSVLALVPEEMVWCGIRLMIGRPPWLGRYLVAPSLERAVELAATCEPGVALVDMQLADSTAEKACGAIRAVSPHSRLLLLTTASQVPARTVEGFGADGYISKGWLSEAVVETIRATGLGLEPPAPPTPGHGLSGRQMEILQLLAAGCTNAEIATRLELSRNTVKQHTGAVYRKLAVPNRAAAIGHAQAMGLLS